MVEKDLQINFLNSISFGEYNIESTPRTFANMTEAKLKTATDMYLYIFSCPGPMVPWFRFYSDLFMNQPQTQIVLTLNRILKAKSVAQNNHVIKIAEVLFNIIASNFSFKYKEIKEMTQGNGSLTSSSTLKMEGKLFEKHS